MRIQFSAGQPRNTVINAARVNASFAKRGAAGSRESQGNRARKDRLTLSPQGKLMSMIDNLTKQKQSIMDRKNSLIEDTLKNGGKVEDIKDQLKNYGRQLADIDKQIAGLYAQQAKEAAGQDDKKKSGRSHTARTEEQAETEYLSNLANLSEGIKPAQTVSSVKDRVEGEIHVREAELGMGELHVDVLSSKGEGVTVKDMIDNEMGALERKERELAGLRDQADQLAESQGKELKDSVEELKESKESAGHADEEEQAKGALPEGQE